MPERSMKAGRPIEKEKTGGCCRPERQARWRRIRVSVISMATVQARATTSRRNFPSMRNPTARAMPSAKR